MLDPELRERIDDRVDQGRRRADRAGLAGALDAERVGAARHDVVGELDRRQILGAGDAVIGQRAGQQLAGLGVEDGSFEHRLADPLRDPALDLPGEQQRIDDRTEIVDHEIAQDVDMPGVGLDLDLADMTAIGEGRLRRREMAALVKAGLDPRRLPRRIEGGARHLLDAEPPIGAR